MTPDRGRLVLAGLVAVAVLLPSLVGLPVALVVAVPAAGAAFAALLPGAGGAALLVGGVALLSLAADAAYHGPKGFVVLWALVEFPALLVLVGRVTRCAGERQAAVVGALSVGAVVALPVRFLFAHPGAEGQAVALTCALALFPAGCAVGAGLWLRTLDNRRARAVTDALRAQRLDVAADLHDFVAHELTGIVLEAQAARFGGGEEDDREALERIEAAGTRALESMDHTVRSLRTEAAPVRIRGLADLPETVGHVPGATLDLADDVHGTLSRAAEDTLHRVVTEALTNVRRHAAGTGAGAGAGDVRVRVRVRVVRVAEGVEVTVTDDGGVPGGARGKARRRVGGGTGLAGLAARVEALGGTLEWGPHGAGWRVRALLPG
ncbi:sensor histidine kinase [Streptomyces sp. NPDC048172]|uniref:sensor histidine kinase n=1 Tax=Streptomyces sp. NPDC048172 TaxID=3365505 RepID=UPI00371FB743